MSWIDYTLNGLIVGNIYALLAVGLALIFGVSRLINFAHGSVFTSGAFIGWTCINYFQLPLIPTLLLVIVGSILLGLAIERIGLRGLNGATNIAPLLATIGLSFVIDQIIQIVFSPDPRALSNLLPDWRFQIGSGTIGSLDIVIAAVGISSATLLFTFLKFTRLGWAVRSVAQDREAAQQMGVNVDQVNQIVFVIASALGGLSGLMVGMYYNYIDPAMSFQATLKGIVAEVVGGVGNIPGAVIGSLLLGLAESWGIALLGTSYRNLFAFSLLFLVLVLKPNGIFTSNRKLPPEPMTGTFFPPSKPVRIPAPLLTAIIAATFALPLVIQNPYVLQTLSNAWLFAMLGVSLTLIAGTVGMISLGHAALLAIGAYSSAILSRELNIPIGFSILAAGFLAAAIGTALAFPAFRLRGHFLSIATLAIGEIVGLVILNWESLTHGPIGIGGIAPLSLLGIEIYSPKGLYWLTLAVLVILAGMQLRLLSSHFGRTFRAIREDDVAARSYGINLGRYKAQAFAFGGFAAGVSGAITAHQYSYINHETFTSEISILALTIVILGGMGNTLGAVIGAIALIGLPEVFRVAQEYRILIYGIALLLLIRFRPQGALGTI